MIEALIPKNIVIEKVKENYEVYKDLQERTITAYFTAVKKEANKLLSDCMAREGNDINIYIRYPKDYSTHYENVIDMLQMDTNESVKLDEASYKKYMLDQWEWKQDFKNTAQIIVGYAGYSGFPGCAGYHKKLDNF